MKINKSAWIRSQPQTLKAREVVEKAKAAGIALTEAQVYTTRSLAKAGTQKRVGRPPATTSVRSQAAALPTKSGGSDELAFRRLVLSIGLTRAESYLADLRRTAGL